MTKPTALEELIAFFNNYGPMGDGRQERIAAARAEREELVESLRAYHEAAAKEWLYQTGQTVRPHANYPPQGTVCGELFDAGELAAALLAQHQPTDRRET